MTLEQALLCLARALPGHGEGELTGRVRRALVALLVHGELPQGLPEADAAALREWAGEQAARGADAVSNLYQELLRREIVLMGEGPAVRENRSQHRRTGAYYTTEPVVRYMLHRAAELVPEATSLLDPACGAGAFLAEAQGVFAGRLRRCVGWDLDPLAATVCRSRVPSAEVAVQDGLLTEAEGGYDLCLGNPPYISSGLRGAASFGAERAEALRRRYPQAAEYKLNTYPLFVQRGLELLRAGGVLGYILPDSFLTGRFFAGLRRLLLQYRLEEVTMIRQDFWAHGRVGQSAILFVRKESPPPDYRVRIRICQRPEELMERSAESTGQSAVEPTGQWAESPGQTAAEVPIADLVWGPLDRIRLVPDPAKRWMLRRMEVDANPLRFWLTGYSGLIARKGQRSLLLPEAAADGAMTGAATGAVADERSGRLLRSGREIDRYHLRWNGARVSLDPALIKSGGNRDHYLRPKLLLRQTADRPRAVLDEQGYFCFNNIHLLVPVRPESNLRALLGLINSTPLCRYYQLVAMEAGRLYPQVDLDLLESLPIPPLPKEAEAELERLVRQRESTTQEEAVLVERQIDQLVERLYGLTAAGGSRTG